MARIRTIKPEFWKHEALSGEPEATHMLGAALLNYADDFGYFNANPALIRGECSPIREPSVSIPESLRRLHAIGYLALGTGPDGRRYGRIVEFDTHQRVSHPTPSKISCLTITWDDSGNPPEPLAKSLETFVPEQGTGNREGEQGKDLTPAGAGPKASRPYSEQFEHFWTEYPTDKNMPKKLAFQQWQKLSAEKRDAAIAAIPAFRRYCEQNKSWYRVIYADRFLSQEKFEGYAADQPAAEPDPSWGSLAERFKAEIGAGNFQAYFADARVVEGDPQRIQVKTATKKRLIEQKFPRQLRQLCGDVVVEVAA